MALSGAVPKRYAEAVLQLAEESGSRDDWTTALDRVAEELEPESLRLLSAPTYPLEARRAALEQITTDEAPGIKALVQTLLERERIALLPAIVRSYHDLLDVRDRIEKAVITTAIEVTPAERRELVARLERESGKRLRATFVVDPALQGGLVVRIGDHQIDGSVRTRLAALRQQLAQGT